MSWACLAGALLVLGSLGCEYAESVAPHVPADASLPPVEGCVDIRFDREIMPDPENWTESSWVARHPFWVDERGVHAVWIAFYGPLPGALKLIVSSFDRKSGELLENRVYDDAFTPGVNGRIWDAAASADGTFGALIYEGNDEAPGGVLEYLAIGRPDVPSLLALPGLPWPRSEGATLHSGWDGETFAVHAKDQGSADAWLARFSVDGALVQDRTYVGTIQSWWEDDSAFHTDPESGRSWLATAADDGPWVAAHERDGTLVPGMEAGGGAVIEAAGGVGSLFFGYVAVASRGDEALLAWQDDAPQPSETRLQRVQDLMAVGSGIFLQDATDTGSDKALVRSGGNWWLGMRMPGMGVESFWLSDTGLVSREPLVQAGRCSPTCNQGTPDFRTLSAFAFQDEVWFGFLDLSDCYLDPAAHPVAHCPYRVLRVKEACRYITSWESLNPE